MLQVTVGHSVENTIVYLDQNGNPMLTAPTPDSAPAWTNAPAPAGADTLTVAPDGSSAVLAALEAGSDTLNLSVTVGGKAFAASVSVVIAAAPQVLTSVGINSVVQ